MLRESRDELSDRVSRAHGILQNARTISSEETMHLLSSIRLGVNLGLIEVDLPTLNRLFLQTQPAHLQKMVGGKLEIADRNIQRARYLKKSFNIDEN